MPRTVVGSGGTLSLELLRAPGNDPTSSRCAPGPRLSLLPCLPGAWTLGPELPGFESQLSLWRVIPGVWGRK